MAFFVVALVVLDSGSLLFVIDAEITILADAFGVKGALGVFTFEGFLGPALRMITVLTHSIGIVGHVIMTAFGDLVSVLLLFNGFSFVTNNIFILVTLNLALFLNFRLLWLPLLNQTLFDNYRKIVLFAMVGVVFS